MTEPGAGSDLRGMNTCARRGGVLYVLNDENAYVAWTTRAAFPIRR